ncbi:MAG: hypothetical protein AAF548_04760 [Actinomycetota bacterium]
MTLDAPTRRHLLIAAAALPVAGAAPFVLDRIDASTATGQELRITSNNGRFQAFADPLPDGASIYAPGPRSSSTITVRDQLDGTSTRLTIDRNLEPEAFSSDGSTLFAIDHRPAHAPEIYRVSTIDVASGEIEETLGPRKVAPIEEMRGDGRQQVWSPLGDQLYTLYIRQWHDHRAHEHRAHEHRAPEHSDHQHSAPEHSAPADHSEVHFTDAFVHVLDVENDWALCVELPDGIGLGPRGSTAIMIDATGTTVTVVDHAIGSLVQVTRLPTEGSYRVGPLSPIG